MLQTFKQRTDYTRAAKAMITKYGNQRIKHMRIHRQPLSAFLMAALNFFTLGDFQRRFSKTPYDKLFHLRVDMYMEDGNVIGVEKNDVLPYGTPLYHSFCRKDGRTYEKSPDFE